MEATIMIVLTVGLSCDGSSGTLCRVFADPAASRGAPAVSSAALDAPPRACKAANLLRADPGPDARRR